VNDTEYLRECPFCGTRPNKTYRLTDCGPGDSQKVFTIECPSMFCGVNPKVSVGGPRSNSNTSKDFATDDEARHYAITKWNTRS